MSLSTATRRNDYTGNGANSVYAYSFKIFDDDDLEVIVRDTNDAETTLTKTTDYTVSGVGSSSGGNVTLVSAGQAWLTSGKLTSDYILTIRRVVALIQSTSIKNQGAFYAGTHEDTFDYLTMIDQQQQDSIDRSVHISNTLTSSDFDVELPSDITDHAGSAILVNASGDGFSFGDSGFAFYAQSTKPNDPTSSQIVFWYDTSVDQMKVWCRTEWRAFA